MQQIPTLGYLLMCLFFALAVGCADAGGEITAGENTVQPGDSVEENNGQEALMDSYEALQGDLTALQEQVAKLKTDLQITGTSLGDNITLLDADITAMTSRIDEAELLMESIEAEILAIQTRLTSAESELAAQEDRFTAAMVEMPKQRWLYDGEGVQRHPVRGKYFVSGAAKAAVAITESVYAEYSLGRVSGSHLSPTQTDVQPYFTAFGCSGTAYLRDGEATGVAPSKLLTVNRGTHQWHTSYPVTTYDEAMDTFTVVSTVLESGECVEYAQGGFLTAEFLPVTQTVPLGTYDYPAPVTVGP